MSDGGFCHYCGRAKCCCIKTPCPWCEWEYYITPDSEKHHLAECTIFQGLPVAEVVNGKTFVALPDNPKILVERVRVQ